MYIISISRNRSICSNFPLAIKWDMTQDDLVIKMQNSTTYDANGEAMHELSGDENRKIIPLSEMGEYIPKAYVAIEDERFYKHKGIDFI